MASNPMQQFTVHRIGPEIKIAGIDLSFTNASLFMLISASTILLFLFLGSKEKKIISIVNLERAAVLTELDKLSEALLVDFGTQDHLIADILFGKEKPGGKLPIELPRSQEAANNQMEDVPSDSENPLYNFGHGLEY